jgi:uridine kinase
MNSNNLKTSQATLAFLLSKAFKELLSPKMLVIEHSFGDGLFCHEANWEPVEEQEIKKIENRMRKYIASDHQLRFTTVPRDKVIEDLYKLNSPSKLAVAKRWNSDNIPVVKMDDYWDYQIDSMELDKSKLTDFELRKYNAGFLLRLPTMLEPGKIGPFIDHPKLFSVMEEHEQWGKILGVSTIRELNLAVDTGEIKDLIWVAEGLHEKKISNIADSLVEDFPQKRLICVSGPSSSGKTTFGKRLRIQLRVNGFRTLLISMDDYFIDRKMLPLDENGQKDFESIEGLDLDLLCLRLDKLLGGKEIPMRNFSFNSGTGNDSDEIMQLGDWDFVLIEGIHGLNPVLSNRIGQDRMNKIFVSAITQLNIDANHRISTSEDRLIRRIVRDHKFRGYTPEQTLKRWFSVRLGEEKNIFPYQEEAAFMFNSSLVYELPVLATYLVPLLAGIKIEKLEVEAQADQLVTYLSFFKMLNEELVPGISILREFIGKSEFSF